VTDGDEVGHGIIEYGVGKGDARYESVQVRPPIQCPAPLQPVAMSFVSGTGQRPAAKLRP
jgi:hypothetical protein